MAVSGHGPARHPPEDRGPDADQHPPEHRDLGLGAVTDQAHPVASIVIPTHNRLTELRRVLAAIDRQSTAHIRLAFGAAG